MDNLLNKNIFCCWTGSNSLTPNRVYNLNQLRAVSKCNITFITKDNLHEYILNEHPFHPGYEYLSETHKADYLRTYLMHFHGGGYSDIKQTTGTWINAFNSLYNSDKWAIGYKESDEGCIGYKPAAKYWKELIGNGAYICKPRTPITEEWYGDMMKLMDNKFEKLKQCPSSFPQDCAEVSNGKYPIEWNEMLGRIFHRICFKYKDKLLTSLPISIFTNYR